MKYARRALQVLGLLITWQQGWALESDTKQPIYIESDSAIHDEGKGETIYEGKVKTVQGSLEVYADRMTVFQKAGKTEKIVATGNPVRLKQTPEKGKEDMHGSSQRAEFFPDRGSILLLENAVIWQGESRESSNRVSSDRIEYDTRHSLMKAGTSSSGSKRVHVTLQPAGDSKN
jgi:lipopolysaccharide export system protein LptA